MSVARARRRFMEWERYVKRYERRTSGLRLRGWKYARYQPLAVGWKRMDRLYPGYVRAYGELQDQGRYAPIGIRRVWML